MTATMRRRDAQRLSEHTTRRAPFALRSLPDEPNDGYTLDGYGAVFNADTIIDSWEGRFKERIAPGAMKKSFRESPPIIQFDHGRHTLIGSLPVAELRSISEDVDPELAPEGGAHVIGRLFDNWLVEPLRDAIRAQAVDGMSFRFSVVREEWRDAEGKPITNDQALFAALERTWYEDVPDDELLTRTLKELKVPEIGPVVWPAYEQTSVSVRSQVIDLGRLNEPEQRKLLARAVFLADTASRPDEGPSTDEPRRTADSAAAEHPPQENDEPQGTTPDVAAEHSQVDTSPQPTGQAGEHEPKSDPAPTDAVDAARASAFERAFDDALDFVRRARESTPPLRSTR
ncbi:HK97 family phage prohead protease [Nocardia wallacei]|uniref:HK97 family phage prohead protease n=1 Tax=Nocardia wallacei TaxID=480035 RepID=UPI0024558F9E|nr:HK97 family phage prohead protease [Nocardia wallacei]